MEYFAFLVYFMIFINITISKLWTIFGIQFSQKLLQICIIKYYLKTILYNLSIHAVFKLKIEQKFLKIL